MNNRDFTRMIQEHQSMLSAFALKFTGDIDDAKDLIQDTMVKALRFSGTFVEGTNIKGWLYTIMRNTFINDYRKNTRKIALITREEEISSANLLHSSTENQSGSSFAMRDIKFALAKLPEMLSVPFIRYFEGYKYHEIAAELDIPLGTVKTHIFEARKHLKKQLSMYQNERSK